MRTRYLLAAIIGGALGVAIGGWITYEEFFTEVPSSHRTWAQISESDTLRVVTVPSSISAYMHKNSWRGHEYEVVQQAVHELGLQMQLVLAPDEEAMLDSIRTGVADLAAWPTFRSVAAAHGDFRPCGYHYELGLVPVCNEKVDFTSTEQGVYRMVIPKGSRAALAMKDEYVLQNFDLTPYEIIEPDTTCMPEVLTEQVVNGQYDVVLLATNVAQLLRTYYPTLKVGRPLIDSEDSVSWVVSMAADTLAAKIDSVCQYDRSVPRYSTLSKRYYEQSLGKQVKIRYLLGNGRLSVYDQLFRNYSKRLGWDWRMLAAVSFVESRFDPYEMSSKGARGLMQLMPSTAMRFGCPPSLVTDPESNVRAGAHLIESYENSLRSRISRTIQPGISSYDEASDSVHAVVEKDLIRFTLASYNAGLGHVFDAIALADTLGYDPAVWNGQVSHCMSLKVDSTYYNMPCVNHGRFNARATNDYVQEVLDTYEDFCKIAQ